MEFPFDVEGILPGRITVLHSKDSSPCIKIYDLASGPDLNEEVNGCWTYIQSSNAPWDLKIKKKKEQLENVLDNMGIASAQAQNLHSPITTLKKLINSSQQKIYIIRDVSEPRCIIGMLKIGIKRLFVCDDVGAHHEVDPLCVLDFYVHESKQRCGLGHELFDAMLKAEGLDASKLAVDRPSFKCLAFLEKHYNLKQPLQQNNNFVIYPGFLVDRPVTRPPIFLYQGKVMGRPTPGSIKHKPNTSNIDSMDALNNVKVPLSEREIKGKTFHSSTGSFLNWNDCGGSDYNHRKQKTQNSSGLSCKQTANSYWNKGEKNWGVHEALHSYSSNDDGVHTWSSNSAKCELTPINSISSCTPKKWTNQLQSSWNIFGVKPLDYSPLHKNI